MKEGRAEARPYRSRREEGTIYRAPTDGAKTWNASAGDGFGELRLVWGGAVFEEAAGG